jgi:hypothetical protein
MYFGCIRGLWVVRVSVKLPKDGVQFWAVGEQRQELWQNIPSLTLLKAYNREARCARYDLAMWKPSLKRFQVGQFLRYFKTHVMQGTGEVQETKQSSFGPLESGKWLCEQPNKPLSSLLKVSEIQVNVFLSMIKLRRHCADIWLYPCDKPDNTPSWYCSACINNSRHTNLCSLNFKK